MFRPAVTWFTNLILPLSNTIVLLVGMERKVVGLVAVSQTLELPKVSFLNLPQLVGARGRKS